ncbi:MAG: hypothetical protein WCX22_13145 [Methanoregula sp.]
MPRVRHGYRNAIVFPLRLRSEESSGLSIPLFLRQGSCRQSCAAGSRSCVRTPAWTG